MKRSESLRRKRLPKGCLIALAVVTVMLLFSGVAFLWARNYFAQQYYRELYGPIYLDGNDADAMVGAPPVGASAYAPAPMLTVPDPAPYDTVSYAVCAQMLAAQHGVDVSRGEFEFLAASTYGASSQDGGVSWLSSVDPELGLAPAAKCLGLERRFYVSEAPDVYLVELRSTLDEGLAARVALDRAVLLELDADPDVQAVVVVGYQGDTFIYHDPLGPGEPQQVAAEAFLAAQRSLAKAMRSPWEYNATVLIVDDKAHCNMDEIWRRNGESLNPDEDNNFSGAQVIERAATVLFSRTTRNDAEALSESLRSAAATRGEMAAYIHTVYVDQPKAVEAALALEEAAAVYGECYVLAQDGLDTDEEARQIGLWLRDAVELEKAAGQAMVDQANE